MCTDKRERTLINVPIELFIREVAETRY